MGAGKPPGGFAAYPTLAQTQVAGRVPVQRNVWVARTDGVAVAVLTALCAFTRLYQIGKRAKVTWDESHFGKFGAYYINRTFYHDVHPPLAKMLIGLSEYLSGHNGTFGFKDDYPPYVNYTFMRCFTALFGIALVPLAYATCHQLNMTRRACLLAALFVLLDNGLCVMSRFVLLDEPLLFFTATSLCSVAGLQNVRHRAFSREWWCWLLLTGASLGMVSSCKWVGFLAVALVGLYTLEEFFAMYTSRMPAGPVVRHFAARALCLIVVPLAIYAACFRVHFAVLNRSGPGDAKMPPAFQARLRGSPLGHQPFAVAYSSQLTLRSQHAGSGLLHSHPHRYPGGSQQQQVTGYGHKDSNNDWVIVRPGRGGGNGTDGPIEPVRHGDTVQLVHKNTQGMLHSHRSHAAHVATGDYEVTVYGKPTWKDANSDWRVEVFSEQSTVSDGGLHAITTQFGLRHVATGCLLSAAGARLPEWGFRQTEVSCSRTLRAGAPSALWVVERHVNDRLPKEDLRSMVRSSFFRDMVQLNVEMARSNNALVPDRDKYNHLESSPWSWPFLIYPMRMLGSWNEGDIKYYEVGNPLLWWASACCCCAVLPLRILYHLARRQRRQPGLWAPGELRRFWDGAKLLWGGWALHYLPFFLMGRVTYIHHYLPALYFALLLLAFEIDDWCRRVPGSALPNAVAACWAAAALAVFCWFAPLTFGYAGPISALKHRQWLPTWNIYVDRFSIGAAAEAESAAATTAFDGVDRAIAVALTVLCLFTRLYRIGRRPVVSWDETHFGKFGAHYINGTFYHDVHPPLAKMLVGLGEFLSGHNGSFAYALGAKYPAHIGYTFQRGFLAVFGALIVPLAYRTCRFLGFGQAAATMAASFVLLDNALCVISRFILLDPPLLCFTAMALLGCAGLGAHRRRPFSGAWWRWLLFTGASLGMVASAKWVGLFAVALVGLQTIEELLAMYAGRSVPARAQAAHWAARTVCLMCLPAAIYVASFQLHFALLRSRGTGDFRMPSEFQALQRNSVVSRQPHSVGMGSHVTLRSHLPGFGLIHSNDSSRFPTGGGWVVAGIAGKQPDNWWQIVSTRTPENDTAARPAVAITDGGIVRLAHVSTRRWLRTGVVRPHNAHQNRRVFADGNATTPSVWDLWRVRIVDDSSPRATDRLYAVTTRFRLFSVATGCVLQATLEPLPAWGRRLSELICSSANATAAEGTLWNVEQVRDKRFKDADFRQLVKRRLLRDTLWINREMARSNNRLVPDPDHYKHTESSPWTWPLLLYPMRMVSWADSAVKYYEIGNPLLWWASTLCCLAYPLQLLYWLLRWRRGHSAWQPGELRRFWDSSKLLWGGWALHYLPFFLMGRVTYIHHYLPALYFALLLLAFEIQCLVRWYLPRGAMWPTAAAAIAAAAGVFLAFSPLTFGWDRPARELAHLAWLPTWNIVTDPNSAL
ncbi:Protein O-mannosyltransferase 2 [Coemansia javaensis]|uniref:dolichyl-phosphate-mannose--protein mannosyltransferase n=1 Tax=Coemansia javaensis TaxID=2761396 RepID=A0A9W8H9J2_9FUNG|nr:Protein O-mannosyltransferase 2 [Coemansia javaensis]